MKGGALYDVTCVDTDVCALPGSQGMFGMFNAPGPLFRRARRGVLFRGVGWDEAGALMEMLGRRRPYGLCMSAPAGTDFRAPGAERLTITPMENAEGGRAVPHPPSLPVSYDGWFVWTVGEAVGL